VIVQLHPIFLETPEIQQGVNELVSTSVGRGLFEMNIEINKDLYWTEN
jgi:hypothetical protein